MEDPLSHAITDTPEPLGATTGVGHGQSTLTGCPHVLLSLVCTVIISLCLVPYSLLDVISLSLGFFFIFFLFSRVFIFTFFSGMVKDKGMERVEELSFGKLTFADQVY